MKGKEQNQTPPILPHSESYIKKVEYGEEIGNQWSFKLIKVDSVDTSKETRESDVSVPVDIEQVLLLNNEGKAYIIFDVSFLKKYSICVINESEQTVSYRIDGSPNNVHFMELSTEMEIEPFQMKCTFLNHYLKFLRVQVFGKSVSLVKVYLQGMK
ncbi:MAG: DUF6385 domain-containing protein [Bacillus sp. (in: firmicutes)]